MIGTATGREPEYTSSVDGDQFICKIQIRSPRVPGDVLSIVASRDGRACNLSEDVIIFVESENGECIKPTNYQTIFTEHLNQEAADELFDRCTASGAESSRIPTEVQILWIDDLDNREARIQLVTMFAGINAAIVRDAMPVSSAGLRNDVICIESSDIDLVISWLNGLGVHAGPLVRTATKRGTTCNAEVPKVTSRPWEGHGLPRAG